MLAAAVVLLVAGCSQSQPEMKDSRLVFEHAPEIFYLTSFGSQDDIEPPTWFERWIIGEDAFAGKRRITKPTDVAVAKGKIYINDGLALGGFWEFDLETRELDLIRDKSLGGSTGMAVDYRGYKYLVVPLLAEAKARGTIWTEKEAGRIVVFDPANRKVREAQLPGRPVSISEWEGKLFVADVVNHRVMILDRETLEIVGEFGKAGAGDSEFLFPKSLTQSRDGRIFVGDTFNGRIKVFTPQGDFLAQYGHRAQLLGTFLYLSGLGVDRDGVVFAVDAGHYSKFNRDEVQYFDSSLFYANGEAVPGLDVALEERKNALLGYFEKPYGAAGPAGAANTASFYQPVEIAVDYDNVGYFQEFVPEGYEFQYLIWLASQGAYSGKNLSVFAYAVKKQ